MVVSVLFCLLGWPVVLCGVLVGVLICSVLCRGLLVRRVVSGCHPSRVRPVILASPGNPAWCGYVVLFLSCVSYVVLRCVRCVMIVL